MSRNRASDIESQLTALQEKVSSRVPGARLTVTALPAVPELKLALLSADYPQHLLSADQVQDLMDTPPYWAFCWASGQVLARYVLNNPKLFQEQTVIDFGCGSGVVGIAAQLAGARRVIGVDLDNTALHVTQLNAALNGVQIECSTAVELCGVNPAECILLIADVFYDRDNLPLLAQFVQEYKYVVVADSRVTQQELTGVTQIARYESHTVPDLDESKSFNSVGIYVSALDALATLGAA